MRLIIFYYDIIAGFETGWVGMTSHDDSYLKDLNDQRRAAEEMLHRAAGIVASFQHRWIRWILAKRGIRPCGSLGQHLPCSRQPAAAHLRQPSRPGRRLHDNGPGRRRGSDAPGASAGGDRAQGQALSQEEYLPRDIFTPLQFSRFVRTGDNEPFSLVRPLEARSKKTLQGLCRAQAAP